MLISAWPSIQAMTPAGREADERVVGASDEPDSRRTPSTREQAEHGERADQPELLADDREDEVVVRLGQPAPLLPAGAEADAPPAAVGQGVEAVHGWQPAP